MATHLDLVNSCRSVVKKVNKVIDKAQKHDADPIDMDYIDDSNINLAMWREEYNVLHHKILSLCKDEAERDLQDDAVLAFEDSAQKARILLRQLHRKLAPTQPIIIPAANVNKPDFRLPRLEMPTFSGSILDWTSFQDLFMASVGNSTAYTECQKLQYLVQAVQGPAAELIKSLKLTDANYQVAWDLLTKRYDNKRLTINANMDLLYELKPATSSKGLRHLLDTSRKQFRVLKGLGADYWNAFQVHLVSSRMDPESRRLWSVHKPGTDYPTFADLDTYLEERCQSLEEGGDMDLGKQKLEPRFQPQQRSMGRQGGSRGVHAATLGTVKMPYKPSSSAPACTVCNSPHPSFRCPELQKMDITARRDTVRAKHLCYNCLRSGHSVAACTSTSTCQKCNGKHHTLLHQEANAPAATADKPSAKVNHLSSSNVTSAIMPTALVNVRDAFGQLRPCRVLLDSGSQVSLVTEGFAKTLGHKICKSSMPILGIGENDSGRTRGAVVLELLSRIFHFSLQAMLYIMPKLTGEMPSSPVFGADSWPHQKCKELADPSFFTPGGIDVILGIDVYDAVLIHGPGTFRRFKNKPSLRKSHFGWLVCGPAHGQPALETSSLSHGPSSNPISCNVVTADVQEQLAKFWELEELPSTRILSPEEIQCENHFASTHQRQQDGRYVVSLPFKDSNPRLGSSKEFAIRRLQQIERRLAKSEEHHAAYNRFMDDYLSLGHMEEVAEPETQNQDGIFYFPHHFVLKESSTTTKLRVVFDGSAKSSSGYSLNDTLLVGPRLQNEIFDVLLRFRQYQYVMIADIEKFFRQVLISAADSNYQRILWRSSQMEPIKEYRLKTVTYETGPAPYLATRALNQLAEDEGDNFPLAKPVILRDFYVDDCMTGEHNLQDALDLQSQLTAALASGGFPLVKWTSNSTEILEAVPPSQRETQIPIPMDKEDSVKALGLYWNPGADAFFFKVNLPSVSGTVSKRTILSDTAKLYDPLGWLSPGIFKAKILLQSLWKLNLGWDDALPSDVEAEWLQFRHELQSLEQIKINRHVINNRDSQHQRHGFCDASEVGYAAAIYLRSEDGDGTVKISLMCSKTKVAPLKTVSIPRLELCSATLLARLISKVQKTLTIPIEATFAWTDSMDVLAWLKRSPHLWKTFVANRVSEIQTLTNNVTWGHVPGKENPADCASRGISPSEVLHHELWWAGPPWLHLDPAHWPSCRNEDLPTEPAELRPIKNFTTEVPQPPDLMSTCSTLGKLQRVTAYCFRFIRNSRVSGYRSKLSQPTQLEPLTRDELRLALEHWVRIVQRQEFSRLFIALSEAKDVPAPFAALMPFVDNNGLLRVGGRLAASGLSFGRRHPLLLPQSHCLTELIVADAHRSTLHGPIHLMSVYLQKQYWIVNMKRIVRRCAYKCVTCTRHRADTMEQRMGNLPGDRVRQSRPFLATGVDYGGPFMIKPWKGRGAKRYKAYIALFVCFATRAVHIELVSELTTECFLAALRRFIARRGKPAKMNSDNGTNFVGANNELKDLARLIYSDAFNMATTDFCTSEGIQWTFIPPNAPHHGGLWEAGIKSAKTHMKKAIGTNVLTFEEMTTVLHQIEACLNSRPLIPLSTDPNDMEALTPSHFLIGDVLLSAPDPDLSHLPENRLSRWQLVQQTSQRFWKRWRNEYLSELQRRAKWTKEEEEVAVGDLVFVKEDGIPPLKWPRGRVIEVHPGRDGKTRVVDLKMSTGSGFQTRNLQRDIRKLCKLPVDSS